MGFRMDDINTIHLACGLESGYTAHQFGQEAVCIAQAMAMAGDPLTPVNIIQKLNHYAAWTTTSDDPGPGLVRTDRLHSLWPQIIDGTQFSLIQGVWGRFNHTLLQWSDTDGVHHFDPYTGLEDFIPAGWHRTGKVFTFSVIPPGV